MKYILLSLLFLAVSCDPIQPKPLTQAEKQKKAGDALLKSMGSEYKLEEVLENGVCIISFRNEKFLWKLKDGKVVIFTPFKNDVSNPL